MNALRTARDINLKELIHGKSYFPSPQAWEDQILYFLLVDRFSDGKEKDLYDPSTDYENALRDESSKRSWREYGDKWNGGTLAGIRSKIAYLKKLGITAIWVSPVFKQVSFEQSYHGYGIQNFLAVDPHLGTEADLRTLVEEAHNQGMYVILDIILNHAGNVFRYLADSPVYNGQEFPVKGFNDANGEPTIETKPVHYDDIWPDGAVWPLELMRLETFSRKGQIVQWDSYPEYTQGDFFSLKNISTGSGEYDSFQPSDALRTLTECYKYWIAFADIDGFRLDTVKHLETGATRYFVREIHEFAETIGKKNFYIFGEITGGLEFAIDSLKKSGIDAALGINRIPDRLENVAKGYLDAIEFFSLFKNSELLGEDEHKWYKDNVVTMFDDHDMVVQSGRKSRFCADASTAPLLLNALFLNLMAPGIPCIYYGTEQGFDGAGDADKYVRESMFGGQFGAFRTTMRHFFNDQNPIYVEFSKLTRIRKEHPSIRQGRVYLREITYDGREFALPHRLGDGRYSGVIVWSRILSDDEIVLAMSCDLENDREVDAVVDSSLHKIGTEFECIYSSAPIQHETTVTAAEASGKTVIHMAIPKCGCTVYRKKGR